MSMFCYQCEQTSKGTGCTSFGVCGKDPDTAVLQDLLIHGVKGLSMYANRARELGSTDSGLDRFTIEVLFSTVTNVNFDPDRLVAIAHRLADQKDLARTMYEEACRKAGRVPETLDGPATWQPAETTDLLISQGEQVGIEKRLDQRGTDATGLEELILYGLKGMAAYADHALILGRSDERICAFFHEALDSLVQPRTTDQLLALALKVGEMNLKTMALLDSAHTETFGHPEPTPVRIEPRKGKAILVSGHDLLDLYELLKQTEGTGIQVYTHGEMLPAHGYPVLKEFGHLAGNYGGAWQDQRQEFERFPGAVLMTTNCIQKPKESYKARLFTTGLVAWPGVRHVHRSDFSSVIDAALESDGFPQDGNDQTILVGFGHQAVSNVAAAVVQAVKNGDIRHFFLIGGCDGAKSGRNYYTDFARSLPQDCVILTLACGKYRFNKLEFGDIQGIPRLLDVGQCNDAYSAIQIALTLAEAFQTDVNHLPLSLILSWYEQKAVAILLTLLHLGIRNIRLGPSLPAFLTPEVLGVLSQHYNLMPTTTASQDIPAILG